jgi:hypothetical protein
VQIVLDGDVGNTTLAGPLEGLHIREHAFSRTLDKRWYTTGKTIAEHANTAEHAVSVRSDADRANTNTGALPKSEHNAEHAEQNAEHAEHNAAHAERNAERAFSRTRVQPNTRSARLPNTRSAEHAFKRTQMPNTPNTRSAAIKARPSLLSQDGKASIGQLPSYP